MSYALDPEDPPGRELARSISEQMAKLLRECTTAALDPPAFVHKARVRCKKIRAALKLARPLMSGHDYRHENRWWRDAARGLSEVRDLTARLEALKALAPFLSQEAGSAAANRLEARFSRERAEHSREGQNIDAVLEFCRAIGPRADRGAPEIADGGREEITEALKRAYGDTRRAMKAAFDDATPENLHEWRKKAKSLSLQMRLARHLFPATLEPRIAEARELAEQLGHLQDIEVISRSLEEGGEPAIIFALEKRRKELIDQAELAGERLFLAKRKEWAREALASEAASPSAPAASPP